MALRVPAAKAASPPYLELPRRPARAAGRVLDREDVDFFGDDPRPCGGRLSTVSLIIPFIRVNSLAGIAG